HLEHQLDSVDSTRSPTDSIPPLLRTKSADQSFSTKCHGHFSAHKHHALISLNGQIKSSKRWKCLLSEDITALRTFLETSRSLFDDLQRVLEQVRSSDQPNRSCLE